MNRSKSSLSKEELVNVSGINQYLYCPRRYWYIYFYDSIGKNYQFKDGIVQHENKAQSITLRLLPLLAKKLNLRF